MGRAPRPFALPPAKLHHPAAPATWHGHSEDNLELDTQDTGPDTARDREGWLFSPRSATPTSDYQETAGEEQMEPPEPAAIARHRKQYPKVVINIGQCQDILKLVDAYSLTKNEIYFDRIINELCVMNFVKDLDFWLIKDINLEICSVDKFNTRRDHILAEVQT